MSVASWRNFNLPGLLCAAFVALTVGCDGRSVVGGVTDDARPPINDLADITAPDGPAPDDAPDATPPDDVSDASDVGDATPPPDGAPRCSADNDCLATPATPLCDRAAMRCVARCTLNLDCASSPTAPICDPTSGRCIARCMSNMDCASSTAGPLCDTVTGRCVARCTMNSDCLSPTAPVCDTVTGLCVARCTTDTDCAGNALAPLCEPRLNRCVARCTMNSDCLGNPSGSVCDTGSGRCVQSCNTNADCTSDSSRPVCDATAGRCVARCAMNSDCRGATPVCNTATGNCVGCLAANDTCPAGQYCDGASNTCVRGCRNDEGCAPGVEVDAGVADAGAVDAGLLDGSPIDAGPVVVPGRRCEVTTHACVECVTDAHCAAGMLCVGNVCVAGCNATRPCPGEQACCAGACVDRVTNVSHCGMCDNRCATPNAMPVCMNAMCAVGACTAPFADCDRMAANGCEENTLSDTAHCGGCGRACPARPNARNVCAAGRCEFTCNAGFADCDGDDSNGCETDTNADPTHCGTCTTVCNPPNGVPQCGMGRCAVRACASGFADCDMNPTNGCETDTRSSTSNCGACGTQCPTRPNAFPGCLGGMCVTSCVMGFQDCDGDAMNGCEADVRTSAANCGACGRACTPPRATGACMAGRCQVTACESGYADCDMDAANGCEASLQSDANHCAGCGMRCNLPSATAACAMASCQVAACATGRGDCDLSAANGCEVDVTSSATNCGTCGTACNLPNATPACAMGRCAVASCNAGFADCDLNPANGCEVNLGTSTSHCGMCNNACMFAGASASCTAGTCTLTMCTAGRGDCDGNRANGCETDTNATPAHCGACGSQCVVPNATAGCASGRCTVASCNAGFADCDLNPANGCEVNTRTDAANCGGCGTRCNLPGATAACVTGACAVSTCEAGRADCDRVAVNGCEVSTLTDVNHCGACGGACNLPNATATCAGGRCAVGMCNAGYADCDGNAANGCETDTRSDPSHCGGCGMRCAPANGRGVCSGSRCTLVACDTGYADCNSNGADGCESNLATDAANCGRCGGRCALANASSVCAAGTCAIGSCNGGFADCNRNPADGCEISTATSPSSCGACGRACVLPNTSSAGCSGGNCTVNACVSGYGNCDGNAANGCEANLASDPSHCGGCGVRPSEACNLRDDNCNGACDDVGGCRAAVHRSYHASTGEHFYTTSASEAACCGFRVEYSPYYYLYSNSASGLVPFYRCIMNYGKHFYTTASNCEGLSPGRVESVMGYIAPSPVCGAVPLYRTYNGSNNDHFYTTSAAERDSALRGGYINEGVAGYVWLGPQG